MAQIPTPPRPHLTMNLMTFAAEDPGGWQPMLDRARAYDQAGIDRLTVSDHVVYGENLDAYGNPATGGTKGGKQPTGPDGHWLEPLTVLSVVSGITSRVRLSTNILLAALRRPDRPLEDALDARRAVGRSHRPGLAQRLLDENRSRVAVGQPEPPGRRRRRGRGRVPPGGRHRRRGLRGDVEAALKRILFSKSDAGRGP